MVNYYTAARKNTYTKNCYNMKCLLNMTSLAQNLFFLLKVFYSMSSNPVNKRGRVAPDVASRNSLTIPFRKVISRKHLKQSFARRVIFYHTLATSSHLEGLDVAVFFWKVGGEFESSFFILYTQAFYKWPVNLPKGWWALPIGQM